MSAGPGVYDAAATAVRAMTKAETVVVIVLRGNKGSGFSVQSDDRNADILLPPLLRSVAAKIEAGIGG